ncbi:hypothetical protein SFR_0835 [Streptomyces sp. FR-008]|nr:hypothetical protein SFR_0835 [Streptomyces sp. FR-008]
MAADGLRGWRYPGLPARPCRIPAGPGPCLAV